MRPGPSQEPPPRRRKGPIWWHKDICAESKVQAVIGREDYFLSPDDHFNSRGNDKRERVYEWRLIDERAPFS